ncbi:Retrovirus Pol polyprotein from type-1 retrotransposable element R2 [Paragonimus skrjabini miyazakii]|uniref:Retrovirus Pol polyprotein from type-1 retrotransposable element R2 n=1 Tax=Paragonimus skrjabini miyazakii TaxID=59628 RepID=A0A8S9YI38_9TREM|nr:Retrovirus Pol polyprotein from type-1 retrotransposable element R2 [Paragonimus skrjabini miyazakii]
MESKRDCRPVAQKALEWNVVAAFGSEGIRNVLRDAAGTAPRADKLLANDLLKWNLEVEAQLFNLMLVLETSTSQLSLARLTFVPKVDEPATPADYRPIAVSSVLQRVMHKVLSKRLKFELVVGNAHRNTLRKLDRLIREKIRAWLRSPKDTTLAFMHSKIDGHGLGIPCLETTIPLEQRAKCERLVNSGTLEVANIVQCKAVMSDITVANVSILVYGKPVGSKLEEGKAPKEALVKTNDGADLMNVQVDRASFYWLRNHRYVFPRLYIRGLQLRGGLLNTKVRSSRGYRRASEDSRCRGLCGCPESIGHILQKCSVTHDARCARHNRVVQMIGRLLRARGQTVFTEPIIPSVSTFCKPDLVVGWGSSILVMDVTIVSYRRLAESWKL